jgi:polynucleotide 5'-kinase involved in rRNA processing
MYLKIQKEDLQMKTQIFKQCSKCKKTKEASEFNTKRYNSGTVGLRAMCKICSRKTSREENKRKREENLRKLKESRGLNTCEICGITHTNTSFFDWHHIEHIEKVGGKRVPTILHHSWDKVKKETDKCLVLCPNCHRKQHLR